MKDYKLRTRDGRIITVLAKSRGNAIKEANKLMKCRTEIVDNLIIKK
jgi:hypothetical protein